MNERVQFIAADVSQGYSMTESCERFGIRRNTGYKWVPRDTEQGLLGLQEKSRAPHHCAHRLSQVVDQTWHPPSADRLLLDLMKDLAPITRGAQRGPPVEGT
jgi:putative transposase